MEPSVFYPMVVAAFAIMYWQDRRRRASFRPQEEPWDEEAALAVAVAVHEAQSRDENLGPLHLLYGIMQDDKVALAVEQCGGDIDAATTAIIKDLDRGTHREVPRDRQTHWTRSASEILQRICAPAPGEKRSVNHILYGLGFAEELDEVLSRIPDGFPALPDVLSTKLHGPIRELSPIPAQAELLLHNDDMSSFDLVTTLLQEHADLSAEEAAKLASETHDRGSARIGRFPAERALHIRDQIHAHARKECFPLRVSVKKIG